MSNPYQLISKSYLFHDTISKSWCDQRLLLWKVTQATTFDIHPLFDSKFYLGKYKDVEEAGVNPLYHYLTSGWREKRWPNPCFDPAFYLMYFPESERDKDALKLYISRNQIIKGRPHPFFDIRFYIENNSDLEDKEPLTHFLTIGVKEKRKHCEFMNFCGLEIFDYLNLNRVKKYLVNEMTHPILEYDIIPWQSKNEAQQQTNISVYFSSRHEYPESDKCKVTFSIIIFITDAAISLVRNTIQSVLSQSYANFDIIIVCASEINDESANYLGWLTDSYKECRIINDVSLNDANKAFNLGANLANGQYIIFLKVGDLLMQEGLSKVKSTVVSADYPDLIFSFSPQAEGTFAKKTQQDFSYTSWSPELLLAYLYIADIFCVKKIIFNRLNGFRTELGRDAIHDFYIRLSEITANISYIAGSAYFDCSNRHSNYEAKESEQPAQKNLAIEEAYKRRGIDLVATLCRTNGITEPAIFMVTPPDNGPAVTIIIASESIASLRKCLASLSVTKYKNYEILIISDNLDIGEESLDGNVKILVSREGQTLFSKYNLAVHETHAPYLLFLDESIEVVDPLWLSYLMLSIQNEGVGAVGVESKAQACSNGFVSSSLRQKVDAKFLNPNIINCINNNEYSRVPESCEAVSKDCFLISSSLLKSLGVFAADRYPTFCAAIDLSVRIRAAGKRICQYGHALLLREGLHHGKLHHEALEEEYLRFLEDFNVSHSVINSEKISRLYNEYTMALFISHNLNQEGAPLFLFKLIKKLKERMPYLCCSVLSPQKGNLEEEYKNIGVEVIIEPVIHKLQTHPNEYKRTIDHLAKNYFENHDVIIANTALSFWAVDIGRQLKIPAIWLIHESSPTFLIKWHLWMNFEQTLLQTFASSFAVVFVADVTMSKWRRLESNNNFCVIPNSLDLDEISKGVRESLRKSQRQNLFIDETEKVLLCVGICERRKGQVDLILASIFLFLNTQVRFKVVLLGNHDRHYSEILKRLTRGLPYELAKNFIFCDSEADVQKYYAAADIYFCGSREESAPLTILEAMASGLPIITTPVDGIPEQVVKDLNAFFYNPGDFIGLSVTIKRLLEDEELIQKMGQASRRIIGVHQSFEEMVEKYENLILACVVKDKMLLV